MLPSKVIHNKAGRFLAVLLTALFFAGCSSQDPSMPTANVQGAATGSSNYYLQLMQQSSDDNKVDWQLLAIRALLKEDKIPQAINQINKLPQTLNGKQRQESRLLKAQLSVAQQDFPGAEAQLRKIDVEALSTHQKTRYYQLVIAAQQGRPSLKVLRAYIAQEPLLQNAADRQKNIDATWQTLVQLTPEQFRSLTINAEENTLQGWLDLLNTYRSTRSDPARLKEGIREWQTRYPYNPGAKMLPTALSQMQNYQPSSTGKIALLLPLSGQAKVFADAIQKGFNDAKNGTLAQSAIAEQTEDNATRDPATEEPPADPQAVVSPSAAPIEAPGNAYAEAERAAEPTQPAVQSGSTAQTAPPSSSTQVQVYDTSTQPIDQVLAQAQQDGATLVVGPLLKSNVEKLIDVQTPLNILALNEPGAIQNRPNLCYFALSPEDEAQEAAHHMWDQGRRSPLLMVPRSSLGDRVSKAFAIEWQKLGGGTVLQQQFGSIGELKQGINSGAGLRLSGTPVENQPQQPEGVTIAGLTIPAPVQDTPPQAESGSVDSVYIVATQNEMALIKPMISMRVSSRSMVKIYASSRSYQAGAGPDYRLEMDGMQFSDVPLLSGGNPALMQQAVRNFNNDYSLVRLYAMGVDAWTLANHFDEMRQMPGFQIKGETGGLSATQECVINRKLSWNQYRQGQIVPAS